MATFFQVKTVTELFLKICFHLHGNRRRRVVLALNLRIVREIDIGGQTASDKRQQRNVLFRIQIRIITFTFRDAKHVDKSTFFDSPFPAVRLLSSRLHYISTLSIQGTAAVRQEQLHRQLTFEWSKPAADVSSKCTTFET